MTRTDEELATKIVYLKNNHYMPNIADEMPYVQNAIKSFYFCSKSVTPEMDKPHDDDFWFKLAFCDYQVSDEFVHEVNRAYKKFLIRNIGISEFEPNVN